jgi:hypothetical protein
MPTHDFWEVADNRGSLRYVEYFRLIFDTIPPLTRGWLAGGALRRLFEGQVFGGHDFDLFFQRQEDSQAYAALLEQCGAEEKYRSGNAITYLLNIEGNDFYLQVVTGFYSDTAEELLGKFDFTVCQFATDGKVLTTGHDSFDHLDNKVVEIDHAAIHSASSTIHRLCKLAADGYKPDKTMIIRICGTLVSNPETLTAMGVVSGGPDQTNPCLTQYEKAVATAKEMSNIANQVKSTILDESANF